MFRLSRLVKRTLVFFLVVGGSHTLQKRSVSSAAAEHTVVPSGEMDVCSTLDVCPVRFATCVIWGYFHTVSWFWLKPWALSSSRPCLLHSNEHT